ncbi:hypothetical protein ACFC96_42635 [Streptomyces sp. NPDC055955]|uniref:hypothetical protein n=1 Tax=Streptomyces sp. NPDC055955 TaxID=3345665 RepID=UPI0035D68FCA
MKRFDLMTDIQLRGTRPYLLSRKALLHSHKGPNPHVFSLGPPVNLSPAWLCTHPAYTMANYGVTILTFGWAAE